MSPGEREDVASELRKINAALGGLVASQTAHGRELAEIKARVKETNGRVTRLEADRIADEATAEERRRNDKIAGRRESDQRNRFDRVKERSIGAMVTIAAVIVGAVLADVRFF